LCPVHECDGGPHKPSLSIGEGRDGRILLRCLAGCSLAAVLGALKLTLADLFPSNVPRRRFSRCRQPAHAHKAKPAAVPVPDMARVDRLVGAACANLERVEMRRRWLYHRGIRIEVVRALRVGFLERLEFAEWPGWEVGPVWVLPITDVGGTIRGVKLHRESPARPPKCFWCPFGTAIDARTGRKRHAFPTLWPPPEFFTPGRDGQAGLLAEVDRTWLNLLPGELKTLAVLSAGQAATSITAGEGFRWTPTFVKRLKPFRVRLVYDDDPAGIEFRDATISALRDRVIDLKAITLGRKVGVE